VTGGDPGQLAGCLVSDSGLRLDIPPLQEKLRQKLRAHMVPVVPLQLPSLPLTANGKLDRKALAQRDLTPRVKGGAPQSAR
ncbi:hypothetical protein, partial [Salmonella enterica]|uniref:hypothetical protein n=1 Tax=Salmonella enterica TaxID=28901 RepID=UPI003299FFEA